MKNKFTAAVFISLLVFSTAKAFPTAPKWFYDNEEILTAIESSYNKVAKRITITKPPHDYLIEDFNKETDSNDDYIKRDELKQFGKNIAFFVFINPFFEDEFLTKHVKAFAKYFDWPEPIIYKPYEDNSDFDFLDSLHLIDEIQDIDKGPRFVIINNDFFYQITDVIGHNRSMSNILYKAINEMQKEIAEYEE